MRTTWTICAEPNLRVKKSNDLLAFESEIKQWKIK